MVCHRHTSFGDGVEMFMDDFGIVTIIVWVMRAAKIVNCDATWFVPKILVMILYTGAIS